MHKIEFPIHFEFNISSLSNDFTATDNSGQTIAYVKQKLFKLKDEITVYRDKQKNDILYKINADQWIDFSAAYRIIRADGSQLGKIARKGWASLWKAKYEIIDQRDVLQFHIREENAWVKVLDGMLGEIPLLGILTGYFFNPAYLVTNVAGDVVVKLSKEPSFWGRKFTVTKLDVIDVDDDERVLLCLMMLVLLERRRG